MPPPRPATEACCSCSLEPGRAEPAELDPISLYAPSSQPAAHAARIVCDRHQTDRGQTASLLNAPWVGA